MNLKQTLVDYTTRLCRIPSLSSDHDQCERIIDIIHSAFSTHDNATIVRMTHNNVPSIIVSNRDHEIGGKHADIVLNAHIDVVPPSTEDQFDIIERDGKLRGRGTADMKAWAAIIIKLMEDIIKTDYTDRKISLIITGDEEVGGFDGAAKVVEAGYTWDIVLIPDGWRERTVVIGQKGLFMAKVRFPGVSCHSSRPRLGNNAVHNAVATFIALRDEIQETDKLMHSDDHRWSSVNMNQISGGTGVNVVADHADVSFDIRFTDTWTLEQVESIVRRECARYEAEVSLVATGHLLYTDPSNPLIQKYVRIASEVVGDDVITDVEHGWCDGRFFAPHAQAIIVHKPEWDNIHSIDERVEIDSMVKIYEIYRRMIMEG